MSKLCNGDMSTENNFRIAFKSYPTSLIQIAVLQANIGKLL